MSTLKFTIVPFGEHGLLAKILDEDLISTARYANAVANHLRAYKGVTESVAGIDSIAVRFHPLQMNETQAEDIFKTALLDVPAQEPYPDAGVEIPVCYGG